MQVRLKGYNNKLINLRLNTNTYLITDNKKTLSLKFILKLYPEQRSKDLNYVNK